jgi:hypothetical protein
MTDSIFNSFRKLSEFAEVEKPDTYYVNWSKVNTLEDFKLLLEAVEFHMVVTEDITMFNTIKHFLEKE